MLLAGLAIVAIVSADVSHLGNGYNYPQPSPSFHEELSLPVPAPPAPAPPAPLPPQEYLPPQQHGKIFFFFIFVLLKKKKQFKLVYTKRKATVLWSQNRKCNVFLTWLPYIFSKTANKKCLLSLNREK